MSRHQERILAFQALFAWDALNKPVPYLPDFSWGKEQDDTTYARLLVSAIIESCAQIDEILKKHLVNWDFNRIGRVELAVLRLGAWCLLNDSETDGPIIINECVKITQEFGAGESYRFVNGILDAIHKGSKKE